MKICSKCKIPKLETEFYKDKRRENGLYPQCKACFKKYREDNKEKVFVMKKQWCENNREKSNITQKKYYENNKEKVTIKKKQYDQSPVGKELRRRRRGEIPRTFKNKLDCNMSTSIRNCLKRQGTSKGGHHWENLVGYKLEELILNLESQFKNGMSWKNYGYGEDKWCIDHGVPIIYFNYDSPEHPEFKVCWGLNNLHPLWCSENFSKGAKLCWYTR